MSAHTTVFARSKEIETILTDCLSVEELVDDLQTLVLSTESYCLSPVEEELCIKRFDGALKRARIDRAHFEYSVEGFKTSSTRILTGLRELIEKLLYELSVFWAESFGHAKRLRKRTEELRRRVQDLSSTRPKKLLVTGEFTITKVLSPTNPLLKVPLELTRDLYRGNVEVLNKYASSLNRWMLRFGETDAPAPIPTTVDLPTLPGSPSFYSRDPSSIVWGMRFNSPKIALDATKSQLQVASRESLLRICDYLYDALETTVSYEREWHNTERGLKQIVRDLTATGSQGYEAAKARRLAYAAAALPRQYARYGLYLSAQLTRYVSVCLDQYD